MRGRRQNSQIVLALPAGQRREAPRPAGEGTEPPGATGPPDRPANSDPSMEEVGGRATLQAAWQRVKANQGSPGIAGRSGEERPGYLSEHRPARRARGLRGPSQPQPGKRGEMPKPGGGTRKRGGPTILDRFLPPAGAPAQQDVAAGSGGVGELEGEEGFDRGTHDQRMGQGDERIPDRRWLKRLRAVLPAGLLADGRGSPTAAGTPLGGPLSPWLSKVGPHARDRELERRGHRCVRDAAEGSSPLRSARAGQRGRASLPRFIPTRRKLTAKSALAPPGERAFRDFSLPRPPASRRRLAPSPPTRF